MAHVPPSAGTANQCHGHPFWPWPLYVAWASSHHGCLRDDTINNNFYQTLIMCQILYETYSICRTSYPVAQDSRRNVQQRGAPWPLPTLRSPIVPLLPCSINYKQVTSLTRLKIRGWRLHLWTEGLHCRRIYGMEDVVQPP